MTPEEKAKQLVAEFEAMTEIKVDRAQAKKYATLFVDNTMGIDYWVQVKQEIEKL